jgi:hypothetical protein
MIDISNEVQDRRKAAEYFASREGFSASGGGFFCPLQLREGWGKGLSEGFSSKACVLRQWST